MKRAYLTIDDSPSSRTNDLVDYLFKKNIPALMFCRGDHMAEYLDTIIRAISKNMVIANHSYSHTPFGDLSYEECIAEIEKTEKLINDAYAKAGAKRPGKYFRFPYLDRSDGDRLERRFGDLIRAVQNEEEASLSASEKVTRLQDYLSREGFVQPFRNVSHPLYQVPDIAGAADCFLTYSTCDWMLLDRHKGTQAYQSLDDLKTKIDEDPFLTAEEGAQIILIHDQPEIFDYVIALVDYLIEQGFDFLQ